MYHKQLPEFDENGNGTRFPTWKWVAVVMLAIVAFGSGLWIRGVDAEIKRLSIDKVDEKQYCRDIQRLEGKIDSLIQFHLEDKQ